MEEGNGLERTGAVGGCRGVFGRPRAQPGWCSTAALLLAFLDAQAAPTQLMSIGAGFLMDTKGPNTDAAVPARRSESFGRLPLMFEAAGSEGSRFFCRGSAYQLWVSPTEAVLMLEQTRNGQPGMRNEPPKLRGLQFPAWRSSRRLR